MKSAVLAATLLAITACVVVYNIPRATSGSVDAHRELFTSWKIQHSKEYKSDAEEAHRFEVFRNNVEIINRENANPKNTHTLAINKFADLTSEEFKAIYNGYRHSEKKTSNVEILDTVSSPSSVNWVKKGAVTAVKNQGQCGSCWSFSTTGSLEGLNVISGGDLTAFSEQQLMDCSWLYGNKGCNGGLMDNAFRYVQVKGDETESAYPYTAQSSFVCNYKKSQVVFQNTGYNDVQQNSVEQLEAAVAQQPVSIAVEADQSSWQFYNGGVVSSNCGQQLDHGVLAAGYDNTGSQAYWLVKNSWGADWGEQGYIRIEKSSANVCGVLSAPSYPTKN